MSIDHPDELAALRAAGRVVAETLRELARRVRPGVTTAELDDVAAAVFARHGARSGPRLDYDFPGTVCISVDDECVHGIPGPRRLREGQLVKLDVTAELDGFYADACRTVPVGRVARRASSGSPRPRSPRSGAGSRPRPPARTSARSAPPSRPRSSGAASASARELTGHGIGRRIHEEPDVPNVAWDGPTLTNGLVITVEPIIAAGLGDVHVADDGWTIRTDDGSPSAHAEHTIVITEAAPLLVTA